MYLHHHANVPIPIGFVKDLVQLLRGFEKSISFVMKS